jgi:hypothetical protein
MNTIGSCAGSGVTVTELARQFGVSRTYASKVLNARVRVELPAEAEFEPGAAYAAVKAMLDEAELDG